MPGIRVQHPTARNVRFTIVQNDIPYNKPYQCTPPEFGGCGSVHLFKTHHLNVDENGSALIEELLFTKVRHLLVLNEFTESNVVDKPPPMGIGMAGGVAGAWGNIPIIHGRGDTHG